MKGGHMIGTAQMVFQGNYMDAVAQHRNGIAPYTRIQKSATKQRWG